jgi:hypothetical protein
MPIKNYTTAVSEEKTVGEIMGLLAAKGARSIQINYGAQGRCSGVSFVLLVETIPVPFRLPCNFEGVRKAMLKECKTWTTRQNYQSITDQVRRIAWRIVKDWVAAQMALIEAEQACLAQVFLPYVSYQDGTTAFDRFMLTVTQPERALGDGGTT